MSNSEAQKQKLNSKCHKCNLQDRTTLKKTTDVKSQKPKSGAKDRMP